MLTVETLRKMPFASIDLHFAAYIQSLSKSEDPIVFAAAAIASAAVRQGHSCCDLKQFTGKTFSEFFYTADSQQDESEDSAAKEVFPGVEEFRKCMASPWGIALTAEMDDSKAKNIPLVLDPAGRLYLNRYFFYEKIVAEKILAFLHSTNHDFSPEKENFNRVITYFKNTVKQTDWQKFAAYLAGISPLTVITGGPGTGKTTVVAAVLALILEKHLKENSGNLPRIMLCAPTGKAQSRLAESISDSLDALDCDDVIKAELKRLIDPDSSEKNCGTIHSILESIYNTPNFYRNQDSPLDADILLADEVSMISLPLMCKLLRALKPGAKLLLLGDKDQLASVESGAVLGDLCKHAVFNVLTPEHKEKFIALTEAPENEICVIPETVENPLTGYIAELKVSRRFSAESQIGKISSMIRDKQNVSLIRKEIMAGSTDFQWRIPPAKPDEQLRKFFGTLPAEMAKLTAKPTIENMNKAYTLLENHKILCALRAGDTGVIKMNEYCRQIFKMREDDSIGLPLLILENDKTTGLSNGDIGIIWKNNSETKVFFPHSADDPEPKSFNLFELPPFEPVFAMTIHKSQGSGFDNVLISLPQKENPILTRELLYTAITRAKKSVELWCPELLIETTLNSEVVRHSGLADRLLMKK